MTVKQSKPTSGTKTPKKISEVAAEAPVERPSSKKKAATSSAESPIERLATVETFSVDNGKQAALPKGHVQLVVNGTDRGVVATKDLPMGKFAATQAKTFGIRTFSVYLDGHKANTKLVDLPLDQISKVEIVAKDSRGTSISLL